MWIINTDGFYSVVAIDEEPEQLLVRTRTKGDAKRFAVRCAPRLGYEPTIFKTPERDYAFRMVVPRAVVGRIMGEAIDQIDYDNFKDAVAKRRGWDREAVYASVWTVLYNGLQRAIPGRKRGADW